MKNRYSFLNRTHARGLIFGLVALFIHSAGFSQFVFEEVLDPREQFIRKPMELRTGANRLAVVDLDADGDFDIVCASDPFASGLDYFENENGVYVPKFGADNPFTDIFAQDIRSSIPAFDDVDNDGVQDLLIGTFDATPLIYFENQNGSFIQQTGTNNPFVAITTPAYASPTFVDLDADTNNDLVIGMQSGNYQYYKKIAGAFVQQTGTDNPFFGLNGGGLFAHPTFADVDNDGDMDLLSGNNLGDFVYFEQVNNAFLRRMGTDNPFSGLKTTGELLTHTEFVDFDNDFDQDIIVGNGAGEFVYITNTSGVYSRTTGTDSPFWGYKLGSSVDLEVIDYDKDGDLDLVTGRGDGSLSYYLNDGTLFTEQTAVNNPFNSTSVSSFATPTFVDVDQDNDLDLVIGSNDGDFTYYNYDPSSRNAYTIKTGSLSPFDGIVLSIAQRSNPIFADDDNDGDLDLISGAGNGRTILVENNNGNYSIVPNTASRFGNVRSDFTTIATSIAMGDLDDDGDLDALILDRFGVFKYYEQTSLGQYVYRNDSPFNLFVVVEQSTISLVDVDNDFDLDILVVAPGDGKVTEFRNLGTVTSVNDKETEKNLLSVYPNPASSVINTEKGQLEIVDAMGNQVFTFVSKGKVDVSGLKPGLYVVIQGNKKTKLIID